MCTFSFCYWILYCVFGQFIQRCIYNIHPNYITKFQKVNQHIAKLIGNLITVASQMLVYFLGGFPLKMFQNFSCFQRQRNRHVFRVMELSPITLITETSNLCHQLINIFHTYTFKYFRIATVEARILRAAAAKNCPPKKTSECALKYCTRSTL